MSGGLGGGGRPDPPWYPMWVPKPLVSEGLINKLINRLNTCKCLKQNKELHILFSWAYV